jgi:transcriptional regulator NrdR family protein
MFAKDKSQDLKTGMEDLPTRETAEKIDLVTESTRGLTGSLREAEGATRDLNFTMEDTLKIAKMQRDFNEKMDKMEKERIKRKQEQFLREKELQALQLAASGDKEKAQQLKRQVELTRKAIKVAEKYKISLQEAAELVQRITEKEANRLNKIEEEKRQKEEEQRAIDEARSGEADKRGDFAKILEGERLREAANAAGEEFGVRFNKEISLGGEEMFRVIRDGFRKELLTEEQLQAGLERAIEKDPSNATLEKIATLLEGRLTNT